MQLSESAAAAAFVGFFFTTILRLATLTIPIESEVGSKRSLDFRISTRSARVRTLRCRLRAPDLVLRLL